MGAITPEMKTYMAELNAQDVPFMIVGMISGMPNSVGGVDVYIIPRITSPKKIKYINFEVEPYNAVGDKVSSDIGEKSNAMVRVTGPLTFGDKVTMWSFSNLWYNNSIHCLELLSVNVEYIDGSEETYKGDTLSKVLAPEKFIIKDRWFCEQPFVIRDPLTGKVY